MQQGHRVDDSATVRAASHDWRTWKDDIETRTLNEMRGKRKRLPRAWPSFVYYLLAITAIYSEIYLPHGIENIKREGLGLRGRQRPDPQCAI